MRDWRIRETMTLLFLSGKTLAEAGFPEKWRYDPLMCVWESDEGYKSEMNGITSHVPFTLSDYYIATGEAMK